MKKVLVGITAAVCAAVMCVGLVACGPNAKGVKSLKVTEEEWNTAFEYFAKDDVEFSIEMSGSSFEKQGDKSITITNSSSGRVKGDKAYVKTTTDVSGNGIGDDEDDLIPQKYADEMKQSVEVYSGVENSTTYVYEKNDEGKWEKHAGSNVADSLLSTYLRSLTYSSYEYNEEEKGYVLTSSLGSLTAVLKFGKVGDEVRLVAIYAHQETDAETATFSGESKVEVNIVFNYGGVADINLPSVD